MLTEEELIQNLPFYEKANKKTREILIKNAEPVFRRDVLMMVVFLA